MYIGKWKITVKDVVWFIICLILIICFGVGEIAYNKAGASDVLAGMSTIASIILSFVALLYTAIDGASSSRINQDTINKLSGIEKQLENATIKLAELNELDRKIKYIVPKLDSAVKKIEESSKQTNNTIIGDSIKEEIQYLKNYIEEDIDE